MTTQTEDERVFVEDGRSAAPVSLIETETQGRFMPELTIRPNLNEDERDPDLDAGVAGRWNRRRSLTALTAALMLASAAGALAWNSSINADLAAAQETAQTAEENLTAALTSATAALTSATAATGASDSNGDVGLQLDGALANTTGSDLVTTLSSAVPKIPSETGPWSQRSSRRDDLLAFASTADDMTATLSTQTTALSESVSAWQLAQATANVDQARTGLESVLTTARTTLAESEGRVLDDSSRLALTSAIDAAQAVHDAMIDAEDLGALLQATADLTAQSDTLTGAVAAVADATAAWQAEQDRIAAEQTAAQAAAAQAATTSNSGSAASSGSGTTSKSSAAKSGTTSAGGGTSSGGSANSSAGSSSSSAGSSASSGDGSTWVESGSDTWICDGDTSGAEAACHWGG